MNNTNNTFVPEWKLEQYLFGELPTDELKTIAALETSDAGVRGRLGALRKSNAEILERFPPEWEIRKIRSMSATRTINNKHCDRKFVLRWAIPATACAAAVLIIVFTNVMMPRFLQPASEAPNYVKEPDSTKMIIVEDADFRIDTILLERGW